MTEHQTKILILPEFQCVYCTNYNIIIIVIIVCCNWPCLAIVNHINKLTELNNLDWVNNVFDS